MAVPRFRNQDLADFSFVKAFDSFLNESCAAALSSHLQSLATPLDRVCQKPAFTNVVTAGLFHIHVLARIEGQNGRGSMPVIRSGNEDGINSCVVQNQTKVADCFRCLTRSFLNNLRRRLQSLLIRVLR